MELKFIVCGSRSALDPRPVWNWLDMLLDLVFTYDRSSDPGFTVVQGGAPGIDMHSRNWCMRRGVPFINHAAVWSAGARAGSVRNLYMLRKERPAFVVHFPGGPGTADMVRQAQENGVPTIKAGYPDPELDKFIEDLKRAGDPPREFKRL